MFERFTERSRRVMILAQEEAMHFRHDYIGTEHLLLGLLGEEDGIAAQTMRRSVGVSSREAREQVESIVGYGDEDTGGQAPFTPRSKMVLEMSLRAALDLGHDYIGTEHLLLGLLKEPEGVAARIFANLGVRREDITHELMHWITSDVYEAELDGKVGRDMEEEYGVLFRGRVFGIRTELALPRLLTVIVDVDYEYLVSGELGSDSMIVEPGNVADFIRDEIKESKARSLEATIMTSGDHLLDTFSAMLEVDVSVSSAPDAPPPAFSVSATLSR